MFQSTTRAFQTVLTNFKFIEPISFSEEFAQKRFLKKFQEPDESNRDRLADECWQNWLKQDESLPKILLPSREWYIARQSLQKLRRLSHASQIPFPQGSEFEPTSGRNSIEARLCRSKWTCTYDAFDDFVELTKRHRALKHAVKKRFNSYCRKNNIYFDNAGCFRYGRQRGLSKDQVTHLIWRHKVSRVITLTQGSRFSTVPKNNEKRRPINIEPFGNILLQRSLGKHLRGELERLFGVNLDTLADVHRIRIKDVENVATVDLSNASDSVSLDLIRFLIPQSLLAQIERYRSSMVLGPDNCYYVTKKISSMGNGFTFELMTLVLTALCRTLDPSATVFGDDIIIHPSVYTRLVELLQEVGFSVNEEKSFSSGPFRESCGANYHQDEGYVESYDFTWPTNIGDCVITWNKVERLARKYPSFARMHNALTRVLPKALHGGPFEPWSLAPFEDVLKARGVRDGKPFSLDIPMFFVTERSAARDVPHRIQKVCQNWGYSRKKVALVQAFKWVPELNSPTRRMMKSASWAKYFMYLHAGRVTKDEISSRGEWTGCWLVKTAHWYTRANASCFRDHLSFISQ